MKFIDFSKEGNERFLSLSDSDSLVLFNTKVVNNAPTLTLGQIVALSNVTTLLVGINGDVQKILPLSYRWILDGTKVEHLIAALQDNMIMNDVPLLLVDYYLKEENLYFLLITGNKWHNDTQTIYRQFKIAQFEN